jgi:hypothetical protein
MGWTTNIQWKGTDLCMDFICPACGEQSHFDGFFAYAIRCPVCQVKWKMPTDVPLERLPHDSKEPFLTSVGENDENRS